VAIKVVLADDSYLVREGMRRMLENEPDIELLAVCEDYDSLLSAIASTQPDVVLTDIRMPPTGTDEGIRAAERLRQVRPAAGVILLSQYADPGYALAFLERGTEGRAYLLKERVGDLDQLLAAIRQVAQGGR
jgi:DNA-binding NarL/FixJ family response regulator